ncbi:low temperature requirement protein A [Pseudonocardia sp. CA-107938]|uniref:low temperature requirement protein A n=1 Tax=Pseudonocardia sp. CA-107938 TaxID=3240021 RepID=UPI003D8F2A5B
MSGRDPQEQSRASTPLELLFDLCFVVAIAQAAVQLAHGIEEDHTGPALLSFAMIFFAIWWAWMNFTWFASAYDTDDVPYRVLTLVQMAGALVLAAGVEAATTRVDFTAVTIGYAIMRVPMVLQWLRAAREHPDGRACALRYAGALAVVQALWLLRLLLPAPWGLIGFPVLVLAELAVPVWAESGGRATRWHPEHIAERYGLLTLIVLGECILGTTVAIRGSLDAAGLTLDLLMLIVGGLLLVFGLWWTYFVGGDEHGLTSMRVALIWGYGHYLVFASIAALGAGLEVAVLVSEHVAHVSAIVSGLAVAAPVAVFLIVISQLRRLSWPAGAENNLVVAVLVVLIVGAGALAGVLGIGLSVLLQGVALMSGLTVWLVLAARRAKAVRAPG